MQKSIFITGASSGLGKATAKLFQSKGWRVFATMRNPENETELTHLDSVTVLRLDVTNPSQIENTIHQVLHNHDIDVVVNNAGYGLVGVLEALSDEQITRQLNTNLLGVIRVTQAFTPFFRQRRKGMFINITSMFGLIGYPTCSIYSATKFAIDGFSESLAYELTQFDIQMKIIAPGGIQTDFVGRSLDGATHPAYQTLIDKVSEGYSEERISQFSKATQIASVIYEAATDQKNQLRYIAGADANQLYQERLVGGSEKQVQQLLQAFTQ